MRLRHDAGVFLGMGGMNPQARRRSIPGQDAQKPPGPERPVFWYTKNPTSSCRRLWDGTVPGAAGTACLHGGRARRWVVLFKANI